MKKEILEFLNEDAQNIPALTKLEVKFFKYLNSKKDSYKRKNELKNLIKDTLKILGINIGESEYYYELYVHNYRPNGDYENITNSELIHPRNIKPKKTANSDSYVFVKSKLPFRGSNLKGEWRVDNLNVPYYVVLSYDWYPIYLWKQNEWYRIGYGYSSSTRKQINNANPVRWDDNIKQKITIVSQDEMRQLESKLTYDQLIQLKKEKLMSKKSELTSKAWFVSFGWGHGDDSGRVKFKISDAYSQNNKIMLNVEIIEVMKKEGRKVLPLGYDYTQDRTQSFSKKNIERIIYNYIVGKYDEIVAAEKVYNDEGEEIVIPSNLVFDIKFKHKE